MRFLHVRTPLRRANETIARGAIRVSSAFGGRRYRRFVIVGIARTGSTLLLNLLNAHSQAVAFGEIFRGDGAIGWDTAPFQTRQSRRLLRLNEMRPLDFLETEVFHRWPPQIAAVGFKLFYYHARTGPQAAVWDFLKDDPEIAVIHIRRLNILEQYLSLKLAHATNVWSSSQKVSDTAAPLHLEPEACLRHFEEVRRCEAECDAFFAGRQIQTVTYEELAVRRSEVMQRVSAQLGLAPEPAEPQIVRQRTQPLSTAIANYEELRDYFAGLVWEDFFRQPDTVTAGQEPA
jgi:LPS sulfotransferase NodH